MGQSVENSSLFGQAHIRFYYCHTHQRLLPLVTSANISPIIATETGLTVNVRNLCIMSAFYPVIVGQRSLRMLGLLEKCDRRKLHMYE